ncbi:putative peptidoglycan muropeptide transporter SLC46 isoform X1 [Nomia melanderi]|uniref:putative peptidoglycan muropeptide transporter SLC46 isoform X1 n=2 Tax=Nomia melanderi TaxID=2448451 RepID=UPI00130446BE|nr:proton-coupled folate transporter-like isoform X2 [Nomia melanderi]XP_031845567.1 proton-coupled folate transporter-like isoform X2 [Nomia melanderi]XP_031845576.1 proton-coupled folate transporter-like isoform X2 [Nomia melanderi]XP_031845583.1 proton-coupled folate transporter-like isoform X2 [Nomia melanderi]
MDQRITGWKRYVLVEPPLMILIFAQAISSNILTDLIVYRVCSVTLNINKSECMLMHENSSSPEALRIDAKVQPEATVILISQTFIQSIFPAFLSLFLGPWSDKHGRKPILILGYIGVTLTYFIFSFMTIWDISPWFLLIAYIPSACFGGFCIILLGSICYISDISDEQDRAKHLAWMETLIFVGVISGLLIGPIIFRTYGYTYVFGIATICCILAGSYICCLTPETICNRNSITLGSLFDIHLVKELISTCTKKRDGFNRYIVWCCIIVIILSVLILTGDMNIGLLFTSARLGWDVNKYSIFIAIKLSLITFGIIFGVNVLTTYTGFSEEAITMLSLFSILCSSLVQSFTWKSWHMYLSAAIGAFSGVATPMIRTILSKSIPAKDTGKVFSLVVSIETLIPSAATSLYGMIYSHFMPPTYPLPVWLVSAGICIIEILVLINMRRQNKKHNRMVYEPLIQDNE